MGTAKRYTPEQFLNLLRQIELALPTGRRIRWRAGNRASPNRPVIARARSTAVEGGTGQAAEGAGAGAGELEAGAHGKTEFERFDHAVRQILSVPKVELLRREAQEKKTAERKRR